MAFRDRIKDIGFLILNEEKMRIANLVENELGDTGCESAHGLSFYIETENHKLLFDTSPSEVLIRNAQKLGVDLTSIDTVILSHGGMWLVSRIKN